MGNRWGTPVERQRSPGNTRMKNNIDDDGVFTSNNGVVTEEPFSEEKILDSSNLRIFSYEELKLATKNFSPDMMLRRNPGGFGIVFKGYTDEQTYYSSSSSSSSSGSSSPESTIGSSSGCLVIAVKALFRQTLPEDWQSKLNFLGGLSHPNLVKLLGCCMEDGKLSLLVYEFMENGSLEDHLFDTITPLSWGIRLKIAIGAAQGLALLHTSEEPIIYGDFKASTILLDENFNAKLSNFGLAENGPLADPLVKLRIMKIYGYGCKQLDPEYDQYQYKNGLATHSDVFNFGVILLEMLTGERAFDTNRPIGQHDLVAWLRPSLSNPEDLRQIMDSRLAGQYHLEGAIQAAQLILKCLEPDHPQKRPSMNEVVKALQKIETLNDEEHMDEGKTLNSGCCF